ncbi:hypothetical protein QUF80_07500 [Desulfococcaceae bacterium HSG8]|nr:hypothetical protein [Desulfococcaceae bacterium HSG8]
MTIKTNRAILAMMLCCIAVLSFPVMAKDFIYIPCVNALEIIDCETDTVVESIPYNDYIVNSVFSPDKKRYYLNAFHSVYAIDTTTNKLIDTYKFSSELSRVTILGLGVSNDNSQLYLSCAIVKKKQNIPKLNVLPPQFVVYDIKTKKMVKNYQIPCSFTGVVPLRNDNDNVILVGLDIHKLNLKTGKLEKLMGMLNPEKGEEAKNGLVIWQNNYPGDHGLFANPYYTESGMGYFIVDKNTGKVSTLKGKDVWFEYSNVISPDKKYLYGVMDELVKIDMKTGETIKAIPVKKGTCYALTLTSDGKKIYVGPAGPDMSVYDTETLELIGTIPLAGDGVIAHLLPK